jgi:hypothetical protein
MVRTINLPLLLAVAISHGPIHVCRRKILLLLLLLRR